MKCRRDKKSKNPYARVRLPTPPVGSHHGNDKKYKRKRDKISIERQINRTKDKSDEI